MQKLMFNDRYGLTKAVIDGTKTQTRRVIKCPGEIVSRHYSPNMFPFGDPLAFYEDDSGMCRLVDEQSGRVVKPRYNFGQRIAVSQPYKDVMEHILIIGGYETEIATLVYMKSPGWNNKMFVRAELMPTVITVNGVKAERIQDISDDDCLCEGIVKHGDGYCFVDTKSKTGTSEMYDTPRAAFGALIRKVSGDSAWDENPFVWAYSFKVEKNQAE